MQNCHLSLRPLFLDVPKYVDAKFIDILCSQMTVLMRGGIAPWKSRNMHSTLAMYKGEHSKYRCYRNVKTVFPERASLLCHTAFVNTGIIIRWKAEKVDSGAVSGSYGKYVAPKCALFPEWHCNMQLSSTLLHSIPGASVSILDEDFLYPNWSFVVGIEILKAAIVKILDILARCFVKCGGRLPTCGRKSLSPSSGQKLPHKDFFWSDAGWAQEPFWTLWTGSDNRHFREIESRFTPRPARRIASTLTEQFYMLLLIYDLNVVCYNYLSNALLTKYLSLGDGEDD